MTPRQQEAIDELRARVQFQGNASLYATGAEAKAAIEEHDSLCRWFMHAHGQIILDLLAEVETLREWRAEMCERLGVSTACGAEWSTKDVFDCVQAEEVKAMAWALKNPDEAQVIIERAYVDWARE